MNPAPVAAALSTRPVSHPGAGVNALMRSIGTTTATSGPKALPTQPRATHTR